MRTSRFSRPSRSHHHPVGVRDHAAGHTPEAAAIVGERGRRHEPALAERRLDHQHREEDPARGRRRRDEALASLAGDGEQHTEPGDGEAQVRPARHGEPGGEAERQPATRQSVVRGGDERGQCQGGRVEVPQVQVVDRGRQAVGDDEGGRRPDPQVRQAPGDPPQRDDAGRQRGGLGAEQRLGRREDLGEERQGVEDERQLVGEEVVAGERQVGVPAGAHEPRPLRVHRQVGAGAERAGAGVGEDEEQHEQHRRHDPRHDAVGPLGVEAGLPTEEDGVDPPPEPRRGTNGGRAQSSVASGGASGSNGASSSGPFSPTLLTIVLTGRTSSSSDGAGTSSWARASMSLFSGSSHVAHALGRQDHRHAVVDLGDLVVRLAGDDRARPQDVVVVPVLVRAPPDLPEAGEGQRLTVGPGDVVRLLALLARDLLPLVEAVDGDDAAPLLERPLVRVLRGHAVRRGR